MSMWDLFRRRAEAAGRRRRRRSTPDERVIAWARTETGAYVVATDRGLRLPDRDRLDWHEIHKAVWSGRELTVTPAEVVEQRDGYDVLADAPPRSVLLLEPREVPQQVRARVTGSVSYTRTTRSRAAAECGSSAARSAAATGWPGRCATTRARRRPHRTVVEATGALVAEARSATTPRDL